VLDSRPGTDQVRRRRECSDCSRRFTTYEKLAESELTVQKRSGRLEPFDRDKLEKVVLRVARNRRLAEKALRDLVRGLEAELLDVGARTVPSAQIAEKLLERLVALDAVSAERFSANYRQDDGSLRFRDEEASPQLELLPPAPEPAVDAPPPRRRGRPPKAARG
jgi:transcriptional repressor NrdR